MAAGEPAEPAMNRARLLTLIGLAIATGLASFGQILMATMSGIVGSLLAPTPQLATLPVTTGIIGVALAALPASALIQRFGWRTVFIGALLWAGAGSVIAAASITMNSFAGFCLGCLMMGNNMAVIAQYRFAAAELVPRPMISRAISGIMLGTLSAAVLAPWAALEFRHLFDTAFSGSYAVMLGFYLAAAFVMTMLRFPPLHLSHSDNTEGPALGKILSRPAVQLAIVAAAAGYGVMSLIMTATPISMHAMDKHSVEVTADVIRSHMLAMFVPSLISGWLIAKLGIMRMLWCGLLLESACIGMAISGHEAWQYRAALVALGLGWNLLFVGGTTLLTMVCTRAETARVRGTNDLIMFSTMALASLSAGGLLHRIGWASTNIVSVILLLLIIISIFRAARDIKRIDKHPVAITPDGG